MGTGPDEVARLRAELARCKERLDALRREIARVIVGYDDVVEQVVAGLLAGGHALLEGAPGLGKTLLVRTLASALDLTFSRVQFTPDLMPADI
ncbi:MAG: AAA family ATPase, partial [Planctomycetes bacterium]|nr:AAA family ATPase [Planctomycetota bacterium]